MNPWLAGLLAVGAGVAAGAVAALAGRRRGLGEIDDIEDADREHFGKAKLYDIEQRMRAAGARGKISFVGAGAEGFVACDSHGKAFKAAWRGHHESSRQKSHDAASEARWFQMAAKIPSIAQHVPKFAHYDAEENVLVRECLTPVRGSRSNSKRLWDLHQRLTAVMAPYGYGRPEFKVDSYVYTKRGPVLVDAGFAINRGGQLVKETLALLKQGEITTAEANDTAFALRHERGSTIPAPIANRLLKRLKAIEPSVDVD